MDFIKKIADIDTTSLVGFDIVENSGVYLVDKTESYQNDIYYKISVKLKDNYSIKTVPMIQIRITNTKTGENIDSTKSILYYKYNDTYTTDSSDTAYRNQITENSIVETFKVYGKAEEIPDEKDIIVDDDGNEYIKLHDTNFDELQGFEIIKDTGYNYLIKDNTYLMTDDYYIIKLKLKENYTVINIPRIHIKITHPTKREIDDILDFQYISNEDIYQITSQNSYYQNEVDRQSIIELFNVIGLAIDESNNNALTRMYKMSNQNIKELQQNRFYSLPSEDIYNKDLCEYIYSFIKYPFDVEVIEQKADFIIGFKKLNFQSELVIQQLYNFLMFSDVINGIYKDNSDIEQCNIYAILPYIGRIDIDNKYINTTIKINCLVDIIVNKAKYIIYSDNIIINEIDFIIGEEIAYIFVYDEKTRKIAKNITSHKIDNINAYIIVEQYSEIDNDLYNTDIWTKLNTLTGYFEVDDIRLYNNYMLNTEYELLKNALREGIYII